MTLLKWIRGESYPTQPHLLRLTELLDVDPTWLLTGQLSSPNTGKLALILERVAAAENALAIHLKPKPKAELVSRLYADNADISIPDATIRHMIQLTAQANPTT